MKAIKVTNLILFAFTVFAFPALANSLDHGGLFETGGSFAGIRDFREVLPGILYRGGATRRGPLDDSQLQGLCSRGIGTAIYLYSTGFQGASTKTCTNGATQYRVGSAQERGTTDVLRAVLSSIRSDRKPIFVHCWYGVHATGSIAAKALMQFCEMPAEKAVQYWKVGVAPSIQYPHVIESIRNFRPDPNLRLTPAEQSVYCPRF